MLVSYVRISRDTIKYAQSQPLAQLASVEEECLQQIFKFMFDSVLDKACTAAKSCHHGDRVAIPSPAFSTPF
jgi:hypothetical protein